MRKKIILSFIVSMTVVGLLSFTAGMEYQRGDVNQDGSVSIKDVTCLIDYLLSGTWGDEPVTPEEPQDETFIVNGVTFNMVAVEGGTFMMGASEDDTEADNREVPAHEVTLSSFSIGQTEVTQALWQAVMGSNPSHFLDIVSPVETVTWDDCQTFITNLNQITGRNFRLPTEAEWEFAARGGKLGQGYKYAGGNTIGDVAWYYGNSRSSTHAVATKAPNELGLYDMSGNVLEWCQDWFDYYSDAAQTNPTGPSLGTYRVCRGGSFGSAASSCRVSFRVNYTPTIKGSYLGLRLAM
jgi:formylglycine-generating enzyme required for sulfatase activity